MATTKKNSAALVRPVESSQWAKTREAERVRYDASTAQPSRLSWKTAGTYTGAELQHRSSGQRIPSVIAGRRVYPGA